jgi:hypothetical protein
MAQEAQEAKEFRPSYWRTSICLSLGLVIIGAVTTLSGLVSLFHLNSGWYVALIGVFFNVVGSVMLTVALSSRMIVTPTYLEYKAWMHRKRVRWVDMKDIRWPSWHFGRAWNAERIVVRIPVGVGPPEINNYIESNVLGESIPIGYFDAYWRKTELGREIFKHAPQLRRHPPS